MSDGRKWYTENRISRPFTEPPAKDNYVSALIDTHEGLMRALRIIAKKYPGKSLNEIEAELGIESEEKQR